METEKAIDLNKLHVWDSGPADKDKDYNNYNPWMLPEQEIPESEKTPGWYLSNARYIASFYNRPFSPFWNNYYGASIPPSNGSTGGASSPSVGGYVYPIYEMFDNIRYRHGKQLNTRFNYMTQNTTTSNLQPNWIAGKKVGQLLDNAVGTIQTLVNNAYFSVRSMSPGAISKRSEFLDNVMIELENQDFIQKCREMGVDYDPANGRKFQTPEEAKDFMENGGYKDDLGELASDIATGLWTENQWYEKALQNYDWIQTCGIGGMEHYVEAGRLYTDIYPPYQLVVDLRKDNDYNHDARFVGVIRLLTPSEIFNRWNYFDKEQKKEIENLCSSTTTAGIYNIMPGFAGQFNWWQYGGSYANNFIACMSLYWIGRRNNGRKTIKTRFGNEKVVDADVGDVYYDSIHQATIIGNRWLVDFGNKTNQVEDITNKNRVRLPIQIFSPKTMMGQIISPVSKIKELQSDADMAAFKIKEMIGNAKSKNFVIKAAKGVNVEDVYQDFAQMHMTVINDETGEPDDEGRRNQRFVETLDMTLDPNVDKIVQFRQLIHNEMEEILSTSKIALGQQQQYIGTNTMQQSLNQSSLGMSYMVNGYMNFIQRNMQYAINMYKAMSASDTEMQRSLLIGNKGMKFFKVTKDFCMEDMLVYLNINDVIEQVQKQHLIEKAGLALQAGAIDMLDYVEIDMSRTYTQLRKYLVRAIGEKKADAQKLQALQMMQAEAASAQAAQTQLGVAAIQTHGKLLHEQQSSENKAKNNILKAAAENSAESTVNA